MGAVPLKRESGMKHGDDVYGQDDVIKERDTKAGAGDTSRLSTVRKFPEMLRWRVWEIWASRCSPKALNRALLEGVILWASNFKGDIFARASISVKPVSVRLVNLIWFQR